MTFFSHLSFSQLSQLSKTSATGCASLGLKIQTGACSSAPSGLLHAFDSPDKASRGLASSCGELANLASPPPTAECCLDLAAFGGAGCACDPVTLTLAQMVMKERRRERKKARERERERRRVVNCVQKTKKNPSFLSFFQKKTQKNTKQALNLNGDGMKSLIRAATAACSAVGVKVSDSCGGKTC